MKNLRETPFNIIYVEEAAFKYELTDVLLNKYSSCTVVPIRHYKDIFNRTNQHFILQKEHQSLILAVKKAPFIYKGPEVCQNFGYKNFYYTSFLLNCVFDCEYCYLQGMYPSANLVAFVNVEDFQNAILDVHSKEPIFLAASYDTDLIGFHKIIPYFDYFYNFFKNQQNLIVEIRTKSANEIFYKKHLPLDNIIIAFTLTPEGIIQKYERHTPSLESRIMAIQTALDQGFKVRICLDPVFINPQVDALYESFFKHIFERIDAKKIVDVGYGFFRMSKEFFKRIEKQRTTSLLFSEEYCVNGDVVSFSEELAEETKKKHFDILTKYIEKEKIFTL